MVAEIAEDRAKMCRSNLSPTDIVASNKNPGRGTKGTREPKKVYKN